MEMACPACNNPIEYDLSYAGKQCCAHCQRLVQLPVRAAEAGTVVRLLKGAMQCVFWLMVLAGIAYGGYCLQQSSFPVQISSSENNLKDPFLRQQLTSMLADLSSDRAVPRAAHELDAILTVNKNKLSYSQWHALYEAQNNLNGMTQNLEVWREAQLKPDYTAADGEKSSEEYRELFHTAKDLIASAAATF